MRVLLAFAGISMLASPVFAQQSLDTQTVIVGPWTIATTYKADKFPRNCTMARTATRTGDRFRAQS